MQETVQSIEDPLRDLLDGLASLSCQGVTRVRLESQDMLGKQRNAYDNVVLLGCRKQCRA